MDSLAIFQAFAAGVLSFFAPCSVAMLPAYVSYYLGRGPAQEQPPEAARSVLLPAAMGIAGVALAAAGLLDVVAVSNGTSALGLQQFVLLAAGTLLVVGAGLLAAPGPAARGVRLGVLVALGILAVFGLLGLPFFGLLRVLDFGAQQALVVGVALVMIAMGVLGLAGRDVSLSIPFRAPQGRDDAAFLTFGVGYGLVALGCNLPLFLFAALGPIVRDGDAFTGLLALLAYGAGMALLMVALSVSLALSRGFTERRLRAAIPHVKRLGHVVLILAGAYILWYDWTVLRPA